VAERFERVIAVDFSSAASPKLGRDSIWIAVGGPGRRVRVENLPTRHRLSARLRELAASEQRTLVLFDVALGWPRGLAERLVPEDPTRRALARLITREIRDEANNANNRFEVASSINERVGAAVFWGYPTNAHRRRPRHLSSTTKPVRGVPRYEGETMRLLERSAPKSIKSPFQLFGIGSVGSQSLLAQALVERLREDVELDVWPFESTGARFVVAEEYFSREVFAGARGETADERQVRGVVAAFSATAREGPDHLDLSRFDVLEGEQRRAVLVEEGWLYGLEVPRQ
jgi:hypothetical protein